ncbi:MAG TPA: sulfur carrier protein ThiS adenylyltransferase ThiF [Victivallales bacterium]|nr:sulfur carrier protein ThiS adenylyltransferase ThiF [Victivallales bacterium]HRR28539.1 sulfur carrier protein ThiS adenylyltransferase ThiF [Victivallales bacterium]
MKTSIFSSNPPGITEILSQKKAFIAGAGGLGSNLAIMLARAGIGTLIICDFDIVLESNLNRQAYFLNQINKAKVDSLKDNISNINPFCNVITIREKLNSTNFSKFIPQNINIAFECFDDSLAKSEIFTYFRKNMTSIPLIVVSGLAGIGPAKDIKIKKLHNNIWLIGDEKSEVNQSTGTISTRVMIAASLQAHAGIRILLGYEP